MGESDGLKLRLAGNPRGVGEHGRKRRTVCVRRNNPSRRCVYPAAMRLPLTGSARV
ncbi:hypothetical protein KCP77_01125 [Salmonella enterica subsp. enterica]|nr:hypothetical protein KCP77_01125 [Salmonella enterica subsp. enterica]